MKKFFRLTAVSTAVAAASLFAISPASFAANANYKADYKNEAPCPPEVSLKDGVYLGVGLGYDAYKSRVSNSFSFGGATFTSNPPISAKGWNGSIFAGYGQYFDTFYIAGEILANTSGAQATWGRGAGLLNVHSKLEARTSYGVSLLPGIKLNNASLLYVRVGYLRTDFKNRESFSVIGGAGFSVSDTEWKNGFNYGLGMETLIYDNLSLRGEYTYTEYNSFRPTPETSLNPSNNEFVLGLIYHFA